MQGRRRVLGTEPGMAGHSPLLSPLLHAWGIMAETGSLLRLVGQCQALSLPTRRLLECSALSCSLSMWLEAALQSGAWGPSVKEQGPEVRTGALSSGGHHRGGCSVPLGHQRI